MTRQRVRSCLHPWSLCVLGLLPVPSAAPAQVGTVVAEQKISQTEGGFGGTLDPDGQFGYSVASLGDLNGDGIADLAVGANLDDDGGTSQGAVWILFLNADGTVASEQKISDTVGGLGGVLAPFDFFGISVAAIGDLDDDGTPDLAVGAYGDDDGGNAKGAVWILFLNPDGTVAAKQQISDTNGGFDGVLDLDDGFGRSVCSLGDLNGDGNPDLAVGATGDDDGGTDQGALWILFLDDDGTVDAEQKISETAGNFAGSLDSNEGFGLSVASLGDLDGDGIPELVAGTYWDSDGGTHQGAVWILFLNADGTVDAEEKISETTGGFGGVLDPEDGFGTSVCPLGDLDGDGNRDLAVGALRDDDGGTDQGAVWILLLNADGTVGAEHKISATSGDFGGVLEPGVYFGFSLSSLGDLDGDHRRDIAVGAPVGGAVWILFLDGVRRKTKTAPPGPLPVAGISYPLQADPSPGSGGLWRPMFGPDAELALDVTCRGEETADTVIHLVAWPTGMAEGLGARGNPVTPVSPRTPSAGEPWRVGVDLSTHPTARATLVWLSEEPLVGRATPLGELLIDLHARPPLLTSFALSNGAMDVHTFSIPPGTEGRIFSVQALILDGERSTLTSALDVAVRGSQAP